MGTVQAISKLYPSAEHRFCLRHIHENMKHSFRGKQYKDMLWKLETCTTVVEFEKNMDELKRMNTDAHLWLSKIPPQHWSRSHFSDRAHSDVLLNNMCEVMNSKIVDGRDKPIIIALEYIREYLMRRIVNVLQVIDRSDGPLTPTATKLFESVKKDATKFIVVWNGGEHFEVAGMGEQCVVDVNQRTCSCRRWEITRMPCKHAVATIWNMASFKIYPINGKSMWPKSRVPTILTPPTHHKQVGRPKKVRKKSAMEIEDMTRGGRLSKKNTSVTCIKCKKKGHNSRTCNGRGQV
ncbi:hypothetical protein L1987_24346 [Smallanthus sonchifolius]|uniref:Uncharacterized protein n=1 Tax=Smallanthus sonchifolius TaxID=185202 RepID=A0ACB9ILN9_9ASTR|nr:hypothetical protein L1987_24346 [Smallanthus sonchifolius]